jgi:hypothetical protein
MARRDKPAMEAQEPQTIGDEAALMFQVARNLWESDHTVEEVPMVIDVAFRGKETDLCFPKWLATMLGWTDEEAQSYSKEMDLRATMNITPEWTFVDCHVGEWQLSNYP